MNFCNRVLLWIVEQNGMYRDGEMLEMYVIMKLDILNYVNGKILLFFD